jgi:sporulation protein YlmC with PRC-barrel domain
MADRHAHRGLRDEAGVGPNPNDARRLIPLRELDDYRVAEGEPDIRGWNVYTATGRELGDIEDLLVDTDMGEVVMVDIDLKRDDRHTLAPIKAAWIDRPNRRVVLNTSMFDVDDDIPALRRPGEPVESESVRSFNERYERAYGADGWDRDRDITIRRANEDFRISRSTPPPPLPPAAPVSAEPRRDIVDDRYTDRPVEREVERVADRTPPPVSGAAGETPQPERRRYVRYGPSRESVIMSDREDAALRSANRADMTPAETERLRQQSGDLTRDARDTLVNPPPTEERR